MWKHDLWPLKMAWGWSTGNCLLLQEASKKKPLSHIIIKQLRLRIHKHPIASISCVKDPNQWTTKATTSGMCFTSGHLRMLTALRSWPTTRTLWLWEHHLLVRKRHIYKHWFIWVTNLEKKMPENELVQCCYVSKLHFYLC